MKLSIIMPVYNLPDLTKRALDSIPYDEDLEVIAVDDCSTDDMSFLESYPGITYIKLPERHSVGYTRNVALSHCKGDYIYGMDNDDYLITDEFRMAMRELDGTDIVFVDQEVNDGSTWHITKENKAFFCAFWTKFISKDLIGWTTCIDADLLDDQNFSNEIFAKPHTEKYTGIVCYHYNYPREGSIIWKKDHMQTSSTSRR